jgi:nucleotide-binding universal stress UspA family protein
MKTVLVGVDGSEDALRAVRFAAELALPHGAELTLACVVTPTPYPAELYGVGALDLQQAEQSGRELLRSAEELARTVGVRTRTEVLYGSPAETLADRAEKGGFELVVVGSRGRGTVARLLVGSVSDRLVHICHRPVLVVR